MEEQETPERGKAWTIARRVRYAGERTSAATLGNHIAQPGEFVKITVERITDIREVTKLNEEERIRKKQEADK